MLGNLPLQDYGLSTDLFVTRSSGADTIVLSGTAEDTNRWVRPLTRRAAHLLWYRLTWSLFPEKSPKVTGMAVTAALQSPDQPTITIHVDVQRQEETHTFSVDGMTRAERWQFTISDADARKLWAALDLLLYPAGWEGATMHTKRTS